MSDSYICVEVKAIHIICCNWFINPRFLREVYLETSASICLFSLSEKPRFAILEPWLLHEEFYILRSAAMNVITWKYCIFSFRFKAVLWARNCDQYKRRLLVFAVTALKTDYHWHCCKAWGRWKRLRPAPLLFLLFSYCFSCRIV